MDEMWDSQVAILSASYAKTTALLEQDKVKEAADEFHANYAMAVKKIFSEAPQTYPERFRKINDWCSWVKTLFISSAKTDKALAGGDGAEAKKLLISMRDSFYQLHQETQTQKAPDYVYAISLEAQKDQPASEVIKDLDTKLASAPLATGVTQEDFVKAKALFDSKVVPLLADGKIAADELPALRAAATAFYQAYGMQFE